MVVALNSHRHDDPGVLTGECTSSVLAVAELENRPDDPRDKRTRAVDPVGSLTSGRFDPMGNCCYAETPCASVEEKSGLLSGKPSAAPETGIEGSFLDSPTSDGR